MGTYTFEFTKSGHGIMEYEVHLCQMWREATMIDGTEVR